MSNLEDYIERILQQYPIDLEDKVLKKMADSRDRTLDEVFEAEDDEYQSYILLETAIKAKMVDFLSHSVSLSDDELSVLNEMDDPLDHLYIACLDARLAFEKLVESFVMNEVRRLVCIDKLVSDLTDENDY